MAHVNRANFFFWALVAALGTSVLVAFGAGDEVVTQVTGVIGAVGSVIAYILAEAYVDGKRTGAEQGDSHVDGKHEGK